MTKSRYKIPLMILVIGLSWLQVTWANLNEGLVAYYPFNGNANDESGKGNDGTVIGASLTEDRFGNINSAYYFDGSEDYIKANASNLPTAERTISLWFYANTIDNKPGLFGYGGGGSCGTSWFMGINNTGSPIQNAYQMQSHCNINHIGYPYPQKPIKNWYHWLVTTDINGTKMYVNGIEVASNNNYVENTTVNGTDLAIGTITSLAGIAPYVDLNVEYFNGIIDDIRIYNRALSKDEVKTLYSLERVPYSETTCLPKDNWISTCPGGDNIIRGKLEVGIDINLDGIPDFDGKFSNSVNNLINVRSDPLDDSINFPGIRPVDGHKGVIDLEMVYMHSIGIVGTATEGWNIFTGVNNGLEKPTYGVVAECEAGATDCTSHFENPSWGYTFFNMFLEIRGTPFGTLHNKNAFRVASETDRVPPLIGSGFTPLNPTTALYDENDVHVANLTASLTTGKGSVARHVKKVRDVCMVLSSNSCYQNQTQEWCTTKGGLQYPGLSCKEDFPIIPLLLTINSFNAIRNDSNKVEIELATGSEIKTARLHIYRAPTILQDLQQIQEVCQWNGTGTNSGSIYSCKDENAPVSAIYWPAETENNGTTNNYLEFMTTVK